MIFVTVGTDLPFDRLIQAVDRWAAATETKDIFAQIGVGGLPPKHMPFCEMLEPTAFNAKMNAASLVIAHAGTGSIMRALLLEKPLIVMPRIAQLGEHRNEHQLATSRHLALMGLVHVAFETESLITVLNRIADVRPTKRIGEYASGDIVEAISDFIRTSKKVTAHS